MICHDVEHYVDVSIVAGFHKAVEVCFGSKIGVQLLPVAGPVAVISSFPVVNVWRYPNSIKAHTLNIIEVILYAFVGAAAVGAQFCALVDVDVVRWGKAIREHLVDSTLFPFCFGGSLDGGKESGRHAEKKFVYHIDLNHQQSQKSHAELGSKFQGGIR